MEDKSRKLSELARLVKGALLGDPNLIINGLADIESAQEGEITFLVKPTRHRAMEASLASAAIVPLVIERATKPIIRVRDPYLAATIIHRYFMAEPFTAAGISSKAHIGNDCEIPAAVSIGPMAVLGDRVELGDRVTIKAGVIIGDDVVIGDDAILHENVTVLAGCLLGNRVIIHSGTVVGSDGFGYATDEKGNHLKRPHVGIVQIDDDVEIGANSTIDRGTFGKTRIRRGTKIDNLVQIAHNVEVGENSLFAAQVGIAGSTSLGRNVILGGQVGVNGHIQVGDGVMAGAKAGIQGSQKNHALIAGHPAIPLKQWLKGSVIYARLPELAKETADLRRQVAELHEKLAIIDKNTE